MNKRDHTAPPPEGAPPAAAVSVQGESERKAYIDGLKSQIRKGVYHPDVRDLARSLASMLVREL